MLFKHIGTIGNIALLFANIIIHLTVQKTTFPGHFGGLNHWMLGASMNQYKFIKTHSGQALKYQHLKSNDKKKFIINLRWNQTSRYLAESLTRK